MKKCDNCIFGSYGLDCSTGIETLYCCENEYEVEVQQNDVCDLHQYIDGYEEILGYDCDGNEINEFRVLRFPDSAEIENWEKEPNIDPRFYCLVKNSNGEIYAISIYDDYNKEYIIKYENRNSNEVPTIIKTVGEMRYYEVAFSGISGNAWYYDRDREKLRQKLDDIIKEKTLTKKLVKNNKLM